VPDLPARAADRGRASPSKGLRIREAVVARAARSGARPSGTPVAASGPRPPGLVLHGVGQFGAGLRDGDVLTSVGGAPARSVGTVVGAVAGALRARAPLLGAVVWRGDEPIQVTVELPRLRD
jgi:S1-C subfamily serine protease